MTLNTHVLNCVYVCVYNTNTNIYCEKRKKPAFSELNEAKLCCCGWNRTVRLHCITQIGCKMVVLWLFPDLTRVNGKCHVVEGIETTRNTQMLDIYIMELPQRP